jgi:hypothetical protein
MTNLFDKLSEEHQNLVIAAFKEAVAKQVECWNAQANIEMIVGYDIDDLGTFVNDFAIGTAPGETPDDEKVREALREMTFIRSCRVCGCTDEDCAQCFAKTGKPCHWIEPDLCSACKDDPRREADQETTHHA